MSGLSAVVQKTDSKSTESPPLVRIEGLSKSYGSNPALSPLTLEIRAGDFFALLGPSGCGKTTLLNLIGGFLKPSSGKIFIAGENVTLLPPEHRRTNMVFQSYGLFPHMTVWQNIAYGLQVARRPYDEVTRKVANLIGLVHLDGMENRLPAMLSGGQQQRVALARALVMEPAVLLLDEPLAALDLKLRKSMQEELRILHNSIGGTFVFVTHDQSEAMALASRMAVMRDGRIEQEGTPRDIYMHPSSEFVARFIGEANLVIGHRLNNMVKLDCGIQIPSQGKDGPVSVMIRPDDIGVYPSPGVNSDVNIAGLVLDEVFMGSHARVTVQIAGGTQLYAHIEAREAGSLSKGVEVIIGWSKRAQQVLERN